MLRDQGPRGYRFKGYKKCPGPEVIRILSSHFSTIPLNQINTDSITGFSYSYKLDTTAPGLHSRGNGIFAETKKKQSKNYEMRPLPLLIATDVHKLGNLKKLRLWLQSLGYFMHGTDHLVIPMHDPVNGINAKKAVSPREEEVSNCYLSVVTSEKLKEMYPHHLPIQGLQLESYPCIFQRITEQIEVGDQLILNDYGSDTDMLFGTPHYISREQQCLATYEDKHFQGLPLCVNCYDFVPYLGDFYTPLDVLFWHFEHKETCRPFMSSYYEPPPTIMALEFE